MHGEFLYYFDKGPFEIFFFFWPWGGEDDGFEPWSLKAHFNGKKIPLLVGLLGLLISALIFFKTWAKLRVLDSIFMDLELEPWTIIPGRFSLVELELVVQLHIASPVWFWSRTMVWSNVQIFAYPIRRDWESWKQY